jgi:hypothetical protein
MKYCVLKNTIKVVDGSDNDQVIMIQNAANSGFTESEVEILTEEQYHVRLSAIPVLPQPKTETELKIEDIERDSLTDREILLDLLMWKFETEV